MPTGHTVQIVKQIKANKQQMHHQRKLKSQTSDGMGRSRGGKSQRRERVRRKKAGARKGRKVAKHYVFFPMICGSGGSASRLAKAADAEPSGQMRDEKLHSIVPRSTCPSQNAKNTSTSEHFWKLRC